MWGGGSDEVVTHAGQFVCYVFMRLLRLKKLTQIGGHSNKVKGMDLVFYPGFNRQPVKYFQEWSSAFTPWFTKDEPGSTILSALKFCKFAIRKARQKRITIIK